MYILSRVLPMQVNQPWKKMLADKYDMVFCGENYHSVVSDIVATQQLQPDSCYIKNLTDWKEFVTRSPEE